VGSRILPVRIHELDHDDRSVIENELDYIEYNVSSLISDYQYLNVEPSFSVLRSEPRFIELLRKVRYRK
jgi:hypothetical protein